MRVLVLGANGLIGSTFFRVLSAKPGLEVFGTVRSSIIKKNNPSLDLETILTGVDARDIQSLIKAFDIAHPEVIINCIGATKHKEEGNKALEAIALNAEFPHRLAELSSLIDSRLIHISTDCVFSGVKGFYSEVDAPDANDIYGRSKALGEVLYKNTITIRTSTIGHELDTNYGLLNWFLSQEGQCKGYSKAIFSGLPTVFLANVVFNYVISNPNLMGLYHVAAAPINKYDLLKLIAEIYNKKIDIVADDSLVIDRSLDSTKFTIATGFVAPNWRTLIEVMHAN